MVGSIPACWFTPILLDYIPPIIANSGGALRAFRIWCRGGPTTAPGHIRRGDKLGTQPMKMGFYQQEFLIKPILYPKLGDLGAKNIVDLIYAGRWIETRANLEGELLPNVRSRSIPPPHRRSIPVFWAPFVALKSRGCGGQDLLSSWVVESSGLLVGSHAGLPVSMGLAARSCWVLSDVGAEKGRGTFQNGLLWVVFLSNQITSNYNPEATQSLTHTHTSYW